MPALLVDRVLPFLPVLRRYDGESARRDLVAAVTVALFTVPQAMAYALIAGFSPSAGIMTAVVASILGAAFGSSEFLVNGPTNAISVMLAANAALLASRGDPARLIVLLTLMIGAVQLVAGLLRAGSFTRFVSEPVLTGFTAGAGVYVAVNQLPPLLGLGKSTLAATLWGWTPPHNVVFDLMLTARSLPRTNPTALLAGAGTLVLVRLLQRLERRLDRRIPATFVAIVLVSAVAYALGLGDAARGAHALRLVRDIEPITRSLPHLVAPSLDLPSARALLWPALAIALLGAVEAIAIGKVLAARVGHPFSASRQLVGEAMCNLGAGAIGGFASSGSFTRSAVNFESGAVTRLSCIFSGLLVLVIVLAFAPAANHIPIAALAGTLVHIGFRLVNVGQIRLLLETTVADRIVLLTTFVGVLLSRHLEQALFLGIAVSIFLALKRAEGFKIAELREDGEGRLVEIPLGTAKTRPAVLAIDLQGELFFAAAEVLERRLRGQLERGTRVLVVRLTHAYNVDATTAEALANVSREARARGGALALSGVRPGTYGTLERAGVVQLLGADAVFRHEPTVLSSTLKALAWAHARESAPR